MSKKFNADNFVAKIVNSYKCEVDASASSVTGSGKRKSVKCMIFFNETEHITHLKLGMLK